MTFFEVSGGALSFAAIQPTGARACCNVTGSPKPVNVWIYDPDCHGEITSLHANELDPVLSDAEHRDLQALLNKLMKRAVTGQIVFRVSPDTFNPEADTIKMVGREYLYELRPQPQATMRFGQPVLPPRVARLYCTEPLHHESSILGLHLATKPSGADIGGEQNDAVEESASRAETWEMKQIIAKLGV